jgi:hypothetical protein
MAKIRTVQTGVGEGKVVVPETGAIPDIPSNFRWNSAKNQLECDRDSSDAMSGGTFHWEWIDDPTDGSDVIAAAAGSWTYGGSVANPASGDVIITLPHQVANRWYRIWKKTALALLSYKTLPEQNRKTSRVCVIKFRLGDVIDGAVSGAKIQWYYDTTDTYLTMHGGKVVFNRKREVYCDDYGAANFEVYRTSETGENVSFTILTRGKTYGPFVKVIPAEVEKAFTQLTDAA